MEKSVKFFHKRDVFVYIVLALVIALSFIITALIFNGNNSSGFSAYLNNEIVFNYSLDKDDLSISEKFISNVSKRIDGDFIFIKITNADGDFNEVKINKKSKSISVINSSCKNGLCKHSGSLTDTGAILCVPNGLKIVPFSKGELIVGDAYES